MANVLLGLRTRCRRRSDGVGGCWRRPILHRQNVTADELVAVGRKYLKANPKTAEWGAGEFLAVAFRDTFHGIWRFSEAAFPGPASIPRPRLPSHARWRYFSTATLDW